MKNLIKSFAPLTREQILALRPGLYADHELLDVAEHFRKNKDHDREMAVFELILRSPEVTDVVSYGELYFETFQHYAWHKEYLAALQWVYAAIAFAEQHEEGLNRANLRRDLAELYLKAGNFDVGLTLYTQLISDDPGDIWLYNGLGMELSDVGLHALAIETLDKGLELVAPKDPHQLKNQLIQLREEAVTQAQSTPDRMGEVRPEVLLNLRAALCLPAEIREGYDSLAPYPPAVIRLTEIGPDPQEAIYAETLTLGRPLIPGLIQLAYDSEEALGAFHAIRVLRAFHAAYPEELALLAPWLDQAEGNWQTELLSNTMGKVGGFSTQDLRQIAADTGENQDIRVSGVTALRERTQRLPALRPATISFFRTLLTRPEAYEAREEHFMAFFVSQVVRLDARELYPEVKQVFDEDRLEPGVLDLNFIHEKWDRPRIPPPPRRMDGLYLPLECQHCGRVREHFTEYVLVDIDSLGKEHESAGYDAHILDHAIVCPKCGAVDRYRLTPLAHLRLAGPMNIPSLTRIMQGKPPDKLTPNPRVLYFRSAVFGKTMHPLDGLDEYRRQILDRPRDAGLHARLGSLLRTLMRYPEALQALQRAYELAPDDPDVLIRRALSEHDFGDREIARQLYEKTIAQDQKQKRFFEHPDENTLAALEGLQRLAQNKPSPAEVKLTLGDGTPVDHPSLRQKRTPQASPSTYPLLDTREKRPTKRGRRGGPRGKRNHYPVTHQE